MFTGRSYAPQGCAQVATRKATQDQVVSGERLPWSTVPAVSEAW